MDQVRTRVFAACQALARFFHYRRFIVEFPSELILIILKSGCLSLSDLACLEITCTTLGKIKEQHHPTIKFRSLVDFAAFQLFQSHPIYSFLNEDGKELLSGIIYNNWKQALNFLSGYIQVRTGDNFTIVLKDSSVYISNCHSLGALLLEDYLKHDQFTRINFHQPISSYVDNIVSVSTKYKHIAFVTRSGDVFTCGDNSFGGCGHKTDSDINDNLILKPRLVEGALKGIPCKQVAVSYNFTVFLTRDGRVYTCGRNNHGQLGHGDRVNRRTPTRVKSLVHCVVVHVTAGETFTLALTKDGKLYSFGSGDDWCLGHGVKKNELSPRLVEHFNICNIDSNIWDMNIVRVYAGVNHVVAIDSNGLVYTWGRGKVGQLCNGGSLDHTSPFTYHRREIYRYTPQIVKTLSSQIAIQASVSQFNTAILMNDRCTVYVYGHRFPWEGYQLILEDSLKWDEHICHICQVKTTGDLYQSVLVTDRGRIFGFGANNKGEELRHGTTTYRRLFLPLTQLSLSG
ncbi:probable E3 ubiquitin-protein ligase HERC1 [Impatiens glandulifera]|uniref:probable E3 ubiquitin-protein ligase HERC1 n=1 Tax=Impatiens glandulifera TaxID=253017 RepID=UPI001FB1881A|nr:probable E3 ubiquitin-protein ligase HERC1 [Impatiens glandulifera]